MPSRCILTIVTFLTDIATVSRENAEPPQPVYRVNGKPAIGLAISMAPTGNMLRFGAALNAKMHAISVTLPHGIEMVKVADQSAVVSDAVSGFIRVLIEAVAIVPPFRLSHWVYELDWSWLRPSHWFWP